VANEWNQHILGWDQWVIPKGSPNADLAREWIAYHVQNLDGQAEGAEAVFYGPINDRAIEQLPEDVASALPNAHADVLGVVIDPEYWATEFDQANERFNSWVSQ
jgi:putative spermidine/putrescine transport system substrate-binding protein